MLFRSVSQSRYLDADVMSGFPGLVYVAVGRQLFLFGTQTQPESVLKFDDESWLEPPLIEDSGAIYANGVLVVGSKVQGYRELSRIPADEGLLVRRFDLPEIRSRAVADEAARVRLAQVGSRVRIGSSDLVLVSHQDVSSNRFLPGCYVDVKSFIVGDDILSKMMLDRYSV